MQAFLDVYDWEIIQSKVKLGDLFNDADYAPVHELRRKFAFSVTYSPVPEAGDFRVDMGNEQAEILKTQYQEHYEAQITKAMGDVFNRTRAVITKLHSEIDWNEGEKSKRIFASVLRPSAGDDRHAARVQPDGRYPDGGDTHQARRSVPWYGHQTGSVAIVYRGTQG